MSAQTENPVLTALRALPVEQLVDLGALGKAFADFDGQLFGWFAEFDRLVKSERLARYSGQPGPAETNTLVTITGKLSENDLLMLLAALHNAKAVAVQDARLERLVGALGYLVSTTVMAQRQQHAGEDILLT